jgi:hypothetical protein
VYGFEKPRFEPKMLIFSQENLAYLAPPKTASTSIQRAFEHRATALFRSPPGLKHVSVERFDRIFRPIFEQKNQPAMQTVALMRDPVAWLGSWYRYRSREALDGQPNSTAGKSFDQFVEAYLAEKQPAYAQVGAQSRFFTNADGEIEINHLFQFEKMGLFLKFMERKIGEKAELMYLNRSPKAALDLSPALLAKLQDAYPVDFALYETLREGPLSFDD